MSGVMCEVGRWRYLLVAVDACRFVSMKLRTPNNPKSGLPAIGTVDRITARAYFAAGNDDGDVQYDGNCDVNWDSQSPVRDDTGRILVFDEDGDEWFTEVDDE